MNTYTTDQIEQARYTQGYRKVSLKGVKAVVYIQEVSNRFIVKAFKGRAKKPVFHIAYKTAKERLEKVKTWHLALLKHETWKKEKRNTPNELKVGDVLSASWGYEQTNVDYYQVTKLIGKTMVVVRELKQKRSYESGDSGRCIPLVGQFTDKEETKHRVSNGINIKIGNTRASKEEPELVAGIPVYKGSSWSSYY